MGETPHYHHNGLGALILILIGAVFLLNNFGILTVDVWNLIVRLWPVLIIFVGLQMIVGRSKAGSLFVAIILVAIITFAILYASNNTFDLNQFRNFHLPIR